ncbi:Exo-beta-D-glucosaminidase precursor [Serratia plymuthica]|nr:Exo-beta-D-glucosaminidase precursor [Serratia plymuthica]VEI20808.1 Exo-beta-D-glucosaminidase precursor [Serratia plymuthica]
MKNWLLLTPLLICACAQQPTAPPQSWNISLDGTWEFTDANAPNDTISDVAGTAQTWRNIKVPANWYSAGIDHQGALWYRTAFSVPPLAADQMATLTFEGVDYRTDAWLNTQYVGRHQGYFQRFQFDVTDSLHWRNQLLVKVDSPFETPGQTWPLHKQVIKGVLSQHDTRPGGAWSPQGQDANSGGIWQPVTLHISRGAAIDAITALPDWQMGLDNPSLRIRLSYRVNRPRAATLTVRLIPDNFDGKNYVVTQSVMLEGTSQIPTSLAAELPMPQAKLWWPYGEGAQNRYRIEATLSDAGGMLDQRISYTGLRQIRWDAQNTSWQLNGRRIFIRGTNYIGSPWLSTMTANLYRRDLLLMRSANINAVRVHGHIAGQALYEQADALGMLLWQDMPLQWGYDDSQAFAQEAARQAGDMLRQLANHPSVIVWAGQNEPPFDSPWMKDRFPDWTPSMNRQLAESVAAVLGQDQTRIVHPWSSVNEHYWQGWYFGVANDFLKPAKSQIISEYGAQALPNLDTLRTIIPPSHLWPATNAPEDPGWEIWQYHNFQPEQAFGLAKLSRGNNIDEFIANTQNYQADVIQLAAESYRRQRYQPVAALFQFMFSETWPSINWAVVDYNRHLKKGYFALQRAYQPILPSIEPITLDWLQGKTGTIGLWAINDRWQNYGNVQLSWRLMQGASELSQGKMTLDLPADSGRKINEIKATPNSRLPMLLVTEIHDSEGRLLGENSRSFTVAAK